MKITLFVSSLSGGGAERVVSNLSNYLLEKGHDITVLTISSKNTYGVDKGVRFCPLCNDNVKPQIVRNVIRVINFYKFILTEKQDIYVSFLPKLNEMMLKNRKLIKTPIVLAERNNPYNFYSKIKREKKIFEKYYCLGDAYIFQTEYAKKFYEDAGIDVSDSIVIPNAINRSFQGKKYTGKRKKEIVGIGRLSEQKNFPLLIKAFAFVHKEFPEYKLKIYGKGPLLEEYIKLVDENGLSKAVEFPGYFSDISDRIIDCAMFVLSSDYEGMSNALMEAMAMGIPCISTDCPAGGSRFLIRNGENGLLVPVNNVGELASAMKKLIRDEAYALALGDEACKISELLDADKIYQQWENYIVKIAVKWKEKKEK